MPTDSDASGSEPNLELPSFGFGRKKKRRQTADDPAPPAPADVDADADTTEAAAPARDETGDEATTVLPVAEPDAPPAAAPRAAAAPPAPPAPARVPTAGPTPARPAARPPARPPSRPVAAAAAPPAPATPADPAAPAAPAAVDAPTAPIPPVVAPAAPDEASAPAQVHEAPTAIDPLDAAATSDNKPRRERKPASALVPSISPAFGAILTGAVSGLAAVGLAIGASRGCEAVRDTSTCGGKLGLLATLLILVLEVALGAALLKLWRIADPVSTSFLGVGLVAIIAMLTFLSHINSIWMLLVIPLMTAATFALSWWVTVRFIDEYDADHAPGEATRAHVREQDQLQREQQDSNA